MLLYTVIMEYIRNKKAGLNFSIEDTLEVGLVLLGTEVKSIKASHGSLAGAYVSVVGADVLLLGAHIPAWQEKNSVGFDPYRTRTLLVHKKELAYLHKIAHTKGFALIPLVLYNKSGKIKLSLGIAKGKKLADKRNTLKEKAVSRDIAREHASL